MRDLPVFIQLKYSTCKESQKMKVSIKVGVITGSCVCLWQIIRVFQYAYFPQYWFYLLGKYWLFAALYLVGNVTKINFTCARTS